MLGLLYKDDNLKHKELFSYNTDNCQKCCTKKGQIIFYFWVANMLAWAYISLHLESYLGTPDEFKSYSLLFSSIFGLHHLLRENVWLFKY